VEVRQNQAVDELLRGQRHPAAALQCPALRQVAHQDLPQVQQGHRSTALQGKNVEILRSVLSTTSSVEGTIFIRNGTFMQAYLFRFKVFQD